jgi:hypothetical protein
MLNDSKLFLVIMAIESLERGLYGGFNESKNASPGFP